MKKASAVFQIVMGSGMIGVWIVLFATNQIPELEAEPVRIAMHIVAEWTTGILLLISGLWTVVKSTPHKTLFYLSLGALTYTLIASPGYYGGKGEWGVFAVFMLMLVATIAVIVAGPRCEEP